MPEGDTVWLAGRRLHDALSGSVLTRSDFRVPSLATTDLAGRTVVEVVSRGKHLLTRIDADLTLHTHFRMDGTWHLYRPGARWHGGPDWQVRVLLETAGWQAVGYRLPVVELLARDDEARAVGHLGPDILGPDWDHDEAVRRLAARPELQEALAQGFWVQAEALRRLQAEPARSIGEALLDQRNVAGIGTLYRAEALFVRGVHPRRPIGDVSQLDELVRLARRLMLGNRHQARQVTTGDARRGREHYVFERQRQPCRRCGAAIETEEFGPPGRERRSYWCPRCQPSP